MPEPARLGRYTLGDKLGEGGMGVVYRALASGAEGFSKAVAIKTIHEALARDPGIRDMFVTEAQTAQRLHHGNIVQIVDVGTDAGLPYLVIELVDGISLSELLRARTQPLPIGDALYIAECVASALAYAHGLTDAAGRPDGVVHRDVTPRNILLSRDGVVKLADFGLAKALSAPSFTLPGTFKGSLGYLAPEQAQGKTIDARADQFAFGIVVHEMLLGRNPLSFRDIESYGAALEAGVPRLDADPALSAIVARMTSIDPSARYPTMDEARAELEAWRVGHGIRTSNDSLRETLRLMLARDATKPTGRALGDLLASSGTSATMQQSPRALRVDRARWLWPVVIGSGVVLSIAGIFVGVSMRHAAPVDAAIDAPADAAIDAPRDAAIDAAPDAIDAAVAVVVVPKKKKGFLNVNVVPYAHVILDGKDIGGVPIKNFALDEGRHTVVLQADQDRVEKKILIRPNETLVIDSWK